MRIVHVQTTIQTTFAVLDDEGNAIPQQPVVVNVTKLSPESFVEAHDAIAKARDDATMATEAGSVPGGSPPNRTARARKPI